MDNKKTDEFVRDLIFIKEHKGFNYWLILAAIAAVTSAVLALLMRGLGIYVLTIAGITFILNQIGNDAIRKYHQRQEDAQLAARLAVVEARKVKKNETAKTGSG